MVSEGIKKFSRKHCLNPPTVRVGVEFESDCVFFTRTNLFILSGERE